MPITVQDGHVVHQVQATCQPCLLLVDDKFDGQTLCVSGNGSFWTRPVFGRGLQNIELADNVRITTKVLENSSAEVSLLPAGICTLLPFKTSPRVYYVI